MRCAWCASPFITYLYVYIHTYNHIQYTDSRYNLRSLIAKTRRRCICLRVLPTSTEQYRAVPSTEYRDDRLALLVQQPPFWSCDNQATMRDGTFTTRADVYAQEIPDASDRSYTLPIPIEFKSCKYVIVFRSLRTVKNGEIIPVGRRTRR
ncbi:uncharacterized protein LOC143214908 isoform X6 [Lasioglossum baleicum]|uniref:uncharacterized protein LOC143214908 isoform X6 n=1 Tax=Lasioglossum baleicum TaxID=434251 RepID=UPI003FCC9D6F